MAQNGLPIPPLDSTVLRIPRVSRPPRLDDFLNGTPREAEVEVREFRQRGPGDGVPVSQDTVAYLSYDTSNLYVVFVCKEEPGKLRARLAKREDIFSDDRVGVFLDTFHDHQRSYGFLSNAHGVQLDEITTEGQGNDYSFDTLWHSEGRVTPEGYVVWMAIPFKSLRFPTAQQQVWGIALGRVIPRNSEFSYWPYVTFRREGFVPQLAVLEGLSEVSPGRNFQFIPYGLFARARFLDAAAPTGPEFRTDNDARVGLDAKVVLRDALTLDVALNPDFSQVESDEPQVTTNQRFEVFFPEKRPFFIENAGFFQTRQNLFFSRRVVDPQFGARLTGKVGRWGLGVLAADDRAPGRVFGTTFSGERAGIGVVRIQREFASQSNLGILVTSRDFGATFNRVYSLDARIKLDPNWVIMGQAIRSDDRALDGARRTGSAYLAEVSYTGRDLVYTSRYRDFSPDFRSALGFVPRVDVRQMDHSGGYFWRPKARGLVAFGPVAGALVNWDRRDRVQDWSGVVGLQFLFTGETFLRIDRSESFELFLDRGFRRHSTSVSFFSEWLEWLGLSVNYSRGTSINFFPAGGPPFPANTNRLLLQLAYRPTNNLRIDQTYIFSRLGTRRGSTPTLDPPGTSIFNNHILRSKVNLQFTRELSLRAILDYNAVLANADLVALERSKRFASDFLVTYLLHPGTALHVGYTDIYENLTLDPTAPPTLRRMDSPTTSTGRQFFAKLSYLFRF